MPGGKAHGVDREYQVMCRDICLQRTHGRFQPYHGSDGIDVAFDVGGTTWHFDVVLEAPAGDLLVAECKRWTDAVPQKEVAVIAHTVELLRKESGLAISGLLFAKTSVQEGALKHAAHEAVEVVVADEGQPLPAFNIEVRSYDPARDTVLRNFLVSMDETVVVTDSCNDVVTHPDGTTE